MIYEFWVLAAYAVAGVMVLVGVNGERLWRLFHWRRRPRKLTGDVLMAEWKLASAERRLARLELQQDWQQQYTELCRRNELSLYGSGPSPEKRERLERQRSISAERQRMLGDWRATREAAPIIRNMAGEAVRGRADMLQRNVDAIMGELNDPINKITRTRPRTSCTPLYCAHSPKCEFER